MDNKGTPPPVGMGKEVHLEEMELAGDLPCYPLEDPLCPRLYSLNVHVQQSDGNELVARSEGESLMLAPTTKIATPDGSTLDPSPIVVHADQNRFAGRFLGAAALVAISAGVVYQIRTRTADRSSEGMRSQPVVSAVALNPAASNKLDSVATISSATAVRASAAMQLEAPHVDVPKVTGSSQINLPTPTTPTTTLKGETNGPLINLGASSPIPDRRPARISLTAVPRATVAPVASPAPTSKPSSTAAPHRTFGLED